MLEEGNTVGKGIGAVVHRKEKHVENIKVTPKMEILPMGKFSLVLWYRFFITKELNAQLKINK